MAIRILIADDDSLIREGLKIIIGMDNGFEVVNCVENGLTAVKACEDQNIDVALLDVRMPIMNGVEATGEIVKKTNTKVVILTTFDEDEYILSALNNGARGYILKNNTPDMIKDTIRAVYSGNSVVQDVVLDRIKDGLKVKDDIDKQFTVMNEGLFTQREIEIIKAISEGHSNKGVAKKLFISEGTVKNYITSILDKTGLEHRTQIAIYYLNGNRK